MLPNFYCWYCGEICKCLPPPKTEAIPFCFSQAKWEAGGKNQWMPCLCDGNLFDLAITIFMPVNWIGG